MAPRSWRSRAVSRGTRRASSPPMARATRVARDSRIEVLANARVTAIRGRDRVTGVEIASGGRTFERPAEGVVIKVGVIPNTEWCAGVLDLDADGYVRVDGALRTSRPRVWAAGDVTRPAVSGIAVAVG